MAEKCAIEIPLSGGYRDVGAYAHATEIVQELINQGWIATDWLTPEQIALLRAYRPTDGTWMDIAERVFPDQSPHQALVAATEQFAHLVLTTPDGLVGLTAVGEYDTLALVGIADCDAAREWANKRMVISPMTQN